MRFQIIIIFGLIIIVGPLICIIMLFYSLSELIKDKKAIKAALENKDNDDNIKLETRLKGLNDDIKKQIVRIIVTGIISAAFIAFVIYIIIYISRIVSGEISIMWDTGDDYEG